MGRRSLDGTLEGGRSPIRRVRMPAAMDEELRHLSGILCRSLSELVREAIQARAPRWRARAEVRQANGLGVKRGRPDV